MKSTNHKMSKIVVALLTAMTGVLMVFFQNCGRINAIEVSDLAGNSLMSHELNAVRVVDNSVSAQILQEDGTIIQVDQHGNESVVQNNQQPISITPVQESKEVIVADDSDSDDLDVCEAFDVKTGLTAAYQKIKCKKNQENKHRDRHIRCLDLVHGNGYTIIDIAKLNDVSVIKSVKGKTLIYSSDTDRSYAKGLVIEHAVGKTIICGIKIARLDIKKGNLELLEGASIKSCGVIKGKIRKDEESSIDGSLTE